MNDARRVLDQVVQAAQDDGFAAHTAHVLLGPDEAVHHWSPDIARDVHSVAKGVCVLAAAIAADEGRWDLDDPVADRLPDWPLGEGTQYVTVRHLLSMTSGLDLPWSPTWATDWPDLARELVSRPTRGRVFQYSPASTYTAMRALATVVGDVANWVGSRLFAPLGITEARWERCPHGYVLGAGGLWLRATDLARIGRLIRDRGRWHGQRVVSSGWPDAMASQWTRHEAPPGYDHYSLGGWGGPGPAWRLHGAHGQLVILLGDAVVTITADDHAGADQMAERVVRILTAGVGNSRSRGVPVAISGGAILSGESASRGLLAPRATANATIALRERGA